MEELGTVFRAICLGLCVCGLGLGGVVAVVLGLVGGGLITTIKDILGIGQRDEDELLDEVASSISDKRSALQQRRSKIVGDDGIPDFDAAVAKYANDSGTSTEGFSSQSAEKKPRGIPRAGNGQRFSDSSSGSLRKRSDRNDDYEIYDDGDFFGD